MCSFSISEPVTTDKTTYVSCQSESPKNHRLNFLSRLSVLLTVKPPILFLRCGGFSVSLTAKPPILCMENFGSVVFWFRSPQNHRYFLWEILARWFFTFAHRKTTDTIWSKIWDWFFPWNFPDGRSGILSVTKTFFYFNVICFNTRNRIMAVCKMSRK